MDALLPPNATVCTDSGTCMFWAFQGIPVRRPGTFFATIDFAPMGCGIAGAIGVALARPDERVVCIAGDGAFLMHGTEVSTAVAQGISVTWIVLNDGRTDGQHRPDPRQDGPVARRRRRRKRPGGHGECAWSTRDSSGEALRTSRRAWTRR